MSMRDERVEQSNAHFIRKRYRKQMVPVFDQDGNALFPCKERRARMLMTRKEAIPFYQKGIFCIKLIRKETKKREEYPEIVLGIDPGSKREGYTVLCEKGVVLNITSNTPCWIKSHLETRRNLRRSRRFRKTPYRKMRKNRSASKRKGRVPPSTKARWDAKIRVINLLCKILPINNIVVEDVKAKTKEGKKKWNKSFSPLEVGKKYFYNFLYQIFENVLLINGYDTAKWREFRDFKKDHKNKLSYKWEAHNVDSHSLAEMLIGKPINPVKKIHILTFLEHKRRQLHKQVPAKKNIRRVVGGTVSLGLSRGSVAIWKNQIGYIGGTSKYKYVKAKEDRISIHDIKISHLKTDNRFVRTAKLKDIKVLCHTKYIIK